MKGFFKKVWNWLKGGNIADLITNPEAHGMSTDNPIASAARSASGKYLGTGLTDAEREANEWTAQREDTQTQRAVQDYKAAGVNPALMFGNGGSTSGYASSSTSPSSGNLSDLLSVFTLPNQLKQMKANIDLQRANADNVRADSELKKQDLLNRKLDYKFMQDTYDARERGIKLAADLSHEQVENAKETRKLINKQIATEIAKAATEAERQVLIMWQSRVEEANEKQITALTPLMQEFTKAQTASQRAAASAALVHAAYEQRVIDSGQIEKQFELLSNQATKTMNESDKAKFESLIAEYKAAIQTGHISEFYEDVNRLYDKESNVGDCVIGGLNLFTNTVGNVFGGLLK